MPASEVTLLIDTGPIVASLIANEAQHDACNEVLDNSLFVYTTWPVITEAAYLLGNYSPAVEKMFTLLRDRTWKILTLGRSDLDGIEQIMSKYKDQGLQMADASLMHAAEREGVYRVLTLDRKDFSVFRTQSGASLEILPKLP